ncbi:hypothetical protein [Sediminibacillus massiliensis]|uniref:hypothetical protein n=1 Tax=Sediminibacillus massiliensis TaxID=1926277 RepID=UPI0009887F30|nr:hypothetical protein [Sediminibacillus massiliensis]
MSEFYTDQPIDVGDVFDSDLNQDHSFQDNYQEVPHLDINSFSRQDIFNADDPLKHAHNYKCPELKMDVGNIHSVDPHYVDGYTRADGTYVDGYYRDGDGNTDVNRTKEEGGGYYRSDPDGVSGNNLG